MSKKKKQFNKVYYVVQTKPLLKVCGHGFSKAQAEWVANFVEEVTGTPGKIIEFTREELRRLNYKRD